MDTRWTSLALALAAICLVMAVVFAVSGGRQGPSITARKVGDNRARFEAYAAGDLEVSVLVGETQKTMALEDYMACVVAGEMPAAYEMEALKAQAVAARTYTLRKMRAGGCNRADGADVCTSSAHCQAFVSLEKMKENWGDDFEANYDKICEAVYETRGQVLLYDGQPIDALYHASSGGKTEDVEHVYSGSALPYLRSVDSLGEGEMGSNQAKKEVSYEDFKAAMKESFDIEISGSVRESVQIVSRYDSGRVKEIKVAGKSLTGKQMRGALSLNSANFTIGFGEKSMVFETRGFGHGVGMSQAGANAMARQGATYPEILLHYYTGVEIADMRESGLIDS